MSKGLLMDYIVPRLRDGIGAATIKSALRTIIRRVHKLIQFDEFSGQQSTPDGRHWRRPNPE